MAIGIGSTLNERFLLNRELGRGGMGEVFSAVDQVLQRQVAIELLKEQSGEEVGRRLRLKAQVCTAPARQYRTALRLRPAHGSTWSWRKSTVQVTRTSSRALASRIGSRHSPAWPRPCITPISRVSFTRDVKSANVLMTGSGQPKLSDFGLSTIVDDTNDVGIVRGTPHYMSPEQAKGRRLDHRSDLYSLGVILYESATGTLPFSASP